MARRPIRFSVGRRRIDSGVSSLEAGYTRAIRAQMEAIERRVAAAIMDLNQLTPEALEFGLQPVFDLSQVLVPVDTGKLKASGFIESRQTARGASAVVGYARGGNPFYAVRVHEILHFRHDPPTQAKFLEEAANRLQGEVATRVADFLRSSIR